MDRPYDFPAEVRRVFQERSTLRRVCIRRRETNEHGSHSGEKIKWQSARAAQFALALARIQFSRFQYADFCNAPCVGRPSEAFLVAASRENVRINQTVAIRIRKKANNVSSNNKAQRERRVNVISNYNFSFNAGVSQLLHYRYFIR